MVPDSGARDAPGASRASSACRSSTRRRAAEFPKPSASRASAASTRDGGASFGACSAACAGTRPEPYFVLAYLTHLAAVGVLFEALRRLTASAGAACAAALLWGAAPVHQEAIGWFSVYGQILAVVIVASMLVSLAKVREG